MFRMNKQREFERKLKYTIDDVLNEIEDSNHILTRILRKISTDSISLVWRVFWGIILTSSVGLCCLLIQDRFAHYFTEPTVVNVQNDLLKPEDMPLVSIVTTASEKFTQYLKEVNISTEKSINFLLDIKCAEPFKYYVSYPNINLNKLWKSLIASEVVERVYFTENPSLALNMNVTYRSGLHGIETEYHIRDLKLLGNLYWQISFDLNLTKFNSTCDDPQIFIKLKMNGVTKSVFAIPSTITSQLSITWHKDVRLKKKSYYCVDWVEHAECHEKCSQQKMIDYKSHCRFPFMKYGKNLPECQGSRNTSVEYSEIKDMLHNGIPISKIIPPCSCPKPCEDYLRNNNFFAVKESGNVVSIRLDPTIKKTIEKFSYDKIALVCDLGGNIGLCLGISCLMIVETLIVFTSLLVKKPKKNKLPDQVHSRITKCANKILKKLDNTLADSFFLPGVEHIISKKKNKTKMTVWSIIIVISVMVCAFQIYDRVKYYLSWPVNIVVKMEELEFIVLPEIVICYENKKSQFAKRKLMTKEKNCPADIDTLEFMDKMTLDKIWERYSIENEYTDLKDINKEINGLTVQPLVAEPYSTVFGKCMKLSTPKARWFLSYSGFFVKIESSAHNKNCTNYVKIFYKSPDEDLDFRNYCHMISPQMMSLAFSFSTIISKNVRHRPCSSMKERQACERKCLLKKVKEKITCSLPFMVNSSLPRCEIKSEAIKNRDEYTSIILHTDPIRDCACLKRCVQDIFTPFSKAVWEYNTPIDQIFVRILHKYKEFIRENYSFTFVKLLCDIGSNLGVVVGMSVMSFMSDISQYINYQQVKQ